MAEVLLTYRVPLAGADGRTYVAKAWGGACRDGTARWRGWVEFVPLDGGEPIRTGRETTQPDRACTIYWATGLTSTYLRGALERALRLASAAPEQPPAEVCSPPPSASRLFQAGRRTVAAAPGARLELTAADRAFLQSLGISGD